MRDTAFKRVLKTMALGTKVSLNAPDGSRTLHGDARIPVVFLAGGIGVTPVRSIVLQVTHDRLPHKIVLFYSNRRPEDAAFLDDLAEAPKRNPNFTLIGTMTQMDKSSRSWNGATGFVTEAMLRKSVNDLHLPIFYISGPPAMVAAMHRLLDDSGVKDDRIRIEEFSGY